MGVKAFAPMTGYVEWSVNEIVVECPGRESVASSLFRRKPSSVEVTSVDDSKAAVFERILDP